MLLQFVSAPTGAITLPGKAGHCPVLSFGSRGLCVTALQRQLDKDNIRPLLRVDGVFGKLTLNAVKSFQSSKGLAADGVVGPKTARFLMKLSQKPNSRSMTEMSPMAHIFNSLFSTVSHHVIPSVAVITCVTVLISLKMILNFLSRIFRDPNVHKIRATRRNGLQEVAIERFPTEPVLRAEIASAYLDSWSKSTNQLPSPTDVMRSIEAPHSSYVNYGSVQY